MKLSTSSLGFPRMGPRRELKFALEKHWRGDLDLSGLLAVSNAVTDKAWELQKNAGIDRITVGDNYLYDGVLTWTDALGIVTTRYRELPSGTVRQFAMARGKDGMTALSK
jgi:5-methyltetrahydropteroyltriglutamate--homocysteine methyltransferase